MSRFSFPDSIDIIIAVLTRHGISADTQMSDDMSPQNPTPSSLHPDNLPFVHLVGMPGNEVPRAPFATHQVQLRVYSTSELTAKDSARLVCDILKDTPLDGGEVGVIDMVNTSTPIMVNSGYGGRVQFNTTASCEVRAL